MYLSNRTNPLIRTMLAVIERDSKYVWYKHLRDSYEEYMCSRYTQVVGFVRWL